MTSEQNKIHGPLLRSGMAFINFDPLDLFGNLRTYIYRIGKEGEVMLTEKFENFSQFCGPCLGSSEIQNMTDPQNKLLIWHWNISIIMYQC